MVHSRGHSRAALTLRSAAAACLLTSLLAAPAAALAASAQLAFGVREGGILNDFLREGPVAAHLVLRAGPEPRILVAFPAGNSGVGLWFARAAGHAAWNVRGQPQPVQERDAKGRPLYGMTAEAVLAVPQLELRQAVLSSIRVLRDYQSSGALPPGIAAAPVVKGRTFIWSRDRLDGAAGYRLTIEVLDGRVSGRRILAGTDGRIRLRITGLTGETPLVPLAGRALLRDPSAGSLAARETLTFLSFREKLLAGSWRFDTYFGRDTLMSVRLLMPVLSATAVEAGLDSVLARLSPQGEVAHEEDIGEQAVLDHMRIDGTRSAAPVYDYKMIDEDYLLAPVAAEWLLQPGAQARSVAFLAAAVGGPQQRRGSRGGALVKNLRFVVQSAVAFANAPAAAHLIGLKPGEIVGDWRDSGTGLGGGRYPYDVDAVLVPAALQAAARLAASGLLSPYLSASDRAMFARAARMASIWRERAPPLFDVTVSHPAAASAIGIYADAQGVPAQPALGALPPGPLRFHALSLSAAGEPIPVMHSDEGFRLLFGDPSPQDLDRIVAVSMRPFPAGLMTGVGMVVANPVFCAPALQKLFTRNAYHGTVVWSWQQALFAAGLARQLERHDLPPTVRADLVQAQQLLWSAIEATRSMQNAELWSWSYEAGHYQLRPFGSSAADADESNAAQLWSTVYLAVRPPGAGADPGFLLNAGFDDLPSYFPGYLGNGFIATLTGPRGTEATQTTLVGFMDDTPGDVARPALVPGWTGIDFNPDASGAGQGWLNRGPMSAQRFQDYGQTLNLYEGTLTTRYRYIEGEKATAVEVVTLVSEASPHLAATRFTLTPDYDGVVRLRFPLTIWAQHSPRFDLARLTGLEQDAALAAHGLSLQPHPPATADRAAVWYPGYTKVRSSGGDARSLSLWIGGSAAHGLAMGMAAAVALPRGVHGEKVTLERAHDRLALDVALRVEHGKSYAFTKFVALSRAGWGGDAGADLTFARRARERGFAALLADQRAAWHALWQSDIEIDGDPKAQQVAHSELYYLLAGTTAGTGWAVGPCAITLCYLGHVFWDSDTWVFPALLLLHPGHARSLVDFRVRTLTAAETRAKQHGFAGAMYPWESDPESGTDVTPHSAHVLADSEIHVNSEVAIAQWQYYLATLDRNWLRSKGWPVIQAVARFWASRVTYDAGRHRYEILHVTSVSESHNDIPNDTYTNMGAIEALHIAIAAASTLGERPDPAWSRIARQMYVPMAADGTHHLPFDPSVPMRSGSFAGGPLSLLFLPALDERMPAALRRADYDFAVRPLPMARSGEVSIGIVQQVAAADEVGQPAAAAAWFELYLTGGTLKPPFNVRTETNTNNTGPFITGSGGYLQSLIFGLTGLRIRAAGLVDAFPPVLPPGWRSLTLRNIVFRGQRMTIRVARDPTGTVRLSGLPWGPHDGVAARFPRYHSTGGVDHRRGE